MKLTGSAVLLAALILASGCGSTGPDQPTITAQGQTPASSVKPAPTTKYDPPKITYSAEHDLEIKEIFTLAKQGEWEEAELKAEFLSRRAPQDNSIKRLHDWVTKQKQIRREQAVEDRIREIDAKNTAFNPTLKSLVTESKDRGLPARKDVRDVVDKIENSPYIPDSYGKLLHQKEPMFDLENTNNRMSRTLEKVVSIHLDNVPLEAIILHVSQAAGVNFVADKSLPALKQSLSVNLDKVRLGEFLRYVARNYDLQFQVGSELVWIVDGKDPKKLLEETRFYKLRKGFVLPAQFGNEDVTRQSITAANITTVTETQRFKKFVNDEAPSMPSIEKAITNMFTGKYLVDYERNVIVARGTSEQLEVLERIIQEFDKPIQQVLIEARFVTVSKPAFLQLGVIWETGREVKNTRSPTDFTGLVAPNVASAVGMGIQETFTNVLNSSTLSATISALEQSGESQTLSAPRLTVINNRPATISDGKVQYYYEEFTVKTTASTERLQVQSFVPQGKPTKVTAGAELDVLASISGDGRSILLALNPRVNTDVDLKPYYRLTEGTNSFEILLPEYRTQELATRTAVKSGETVVMGGVLERQKSTFVESVPVLGNLPVIGFLFRRRTEVDKPRYLLVFVTATILSESGEFLVYGDDPSAPK